jgi:23S rRNA (guanosine2251-2'-O)-methyltransferase
MKKEYMIIGRQPIIEALQSGTVIDKILVQKNSSGDVLHQIRELANLYKVPIQMVPIEKLNGLVRANHQGIIAFAARVMYHSLNDVLIEIENKKEVPFLVMLDGVTDVRNIGAIARSAYICGCQAIIIPDKGVGAINEEALKSSAGALEHIKIIRENSLLKSIDTLHSKGIQVFTTGMKATTAVNDLPLQEPCCIIMGNEEKGVQPYIAKAADIQFTIPMAKKFDSFNVSVAAGIILYEGMKKRMQS